MVEFNFKTIFFSCPQNTQRGPPQISPRLFSENFDVGNIVEKCRKLVRKLSEFVGKMWEECLTYRKKLAKAKMFETQNLREKT